MEHVSVVLEILGAQSVHITVVFLIAAALGFVFRNASAHWHYLIWSLVVIKCFVPPFMTIPMAVLPADDAPQVQQATQAVPISAAASEGKTASPEPVTTSPQKTSIHDSSYFTPSKGGLAQETAAIDTTAAPRQQPPAKGQTQAGVLENLKKYAGAGYLLAVWLAGVAVTLGVIVAKATGLSAWLKRERHQAGAGLERDVYQMLETSGVKVRPGLWLVSGISQPFVWGLGRGAIYLPANFAEAKNPQHRRQVIMHETAHVIRFDAFANSLQLLAQAMFWFHPLVWWANAIIRRQREKCCDEMAIAMLRSTPRQYTSAIVDVLVSEYESSQAVPTLAVAGPVKNIEDRIKTVLAPGKKFRSRPGAFAVITFLIAAAVLIPTTLALRTRTPEAAEQMAATDNTENSKYRKTLDNGTAVELLGVCEFPADDNNWWLADGSRWQPDFRTQQNGNVVSDGKAYVIVVKAEGPKGMSYEWGPVKGSTGMSSLSVYGADGKEPDNVHAARFNIKGPLDETSLKIGTAAGSWKTKFSHDGRGTMTTSKGEHNIAFAKAYDLDGKVELTVTDNFFGMDYRLVAVDKAGRIRKNTGHNSGSSGGLRQSTFQFWGMKLKDIEEFHFQTRPYEWVTFENISLRPGFKSEVQIADENSSHNEKQFKYKTLVLSKDNVVFNGKDMQGVEALTKEFDADTDRNNSILQVIISNSIDTEDRETVRNMALAWCKEYGYADIVFMADGKQAVENGHSDTVEFLTPEQQSGPVEKSRDDIVEHNIVVDAGVGFADAIGVGFGDIIINDPRTRKGDVAKLLGKPERFDRNKLDYNSTLGLDFWFNDDGILREIHLNRGFRGSLSSGIDMSSTRDEVFEIYGRPVREQVLESLNRQNENMVLNKLQGQEHISRIYYRDKGVLFWFNGQSINQIVVFSVPDAVLEKARIERTQNTKPAVEVPMPALPGAAAGKALVAELPNGCAIEFVGLVRLTELGLEAWRPDGTAMEMPCVLPADVEGLSTVAVFKNSGANVRYTPCYQSGRQINSLSKMMFELEGCEFTMVPLIHVPTSSGNMLDKKNYLNMVLQVDSFGPRKYLFELELGDMLEQNPKGRQRSYENREKLGPYGISQILFAVTSPSSFRIEPMGPGVNDIQGRGFCAVTKEGEVMCPVMQTSNRGRVMYDFDFPIEQFRGLARYDYDRAEVRFRNISLEHGRQARVRVETDLFTVENAIELDVPKEQSQQPQQQQAQPQPDKQRQAGQQKTRQQPPREFEDEFAIYLVKSPVKMRMFADADIADVELEYFITEQDIESYRWGDHSITLTDTGIEKIKLLAGPGEVPLQGLPFVVVAGGRRAYKGCFWSPLSSMIPPVPYCTLPPNLNSLGNTIRIDALQAGSLGVEQTPPDPRENMQVHEALRKSGKLARIMINANLILIDKNELAEVEKSIRDGRFKETNRLDLLKRSARSVTAPTVMTLEGTQASLKTKLENDDGLENDVVQVADGENYKLLFEVTPELVDPGNIKLDFIISTDVVKNFSGDEKKDVSIENVSSIVVNGSEVVQNAGTVLITGPEVSCESRLGQYEKNSRCVVLYLIKADKVEKEN